MLILNPKWYPWCWPRTLNRKRYESPYWLWNCTKQKENIWQIPCSGRSRPRQNFLRVNGTILDRTIDGAPSVTTKREWMGKSVLVEVNYEAYSTNLLKLNQIGDMPVRVSAHWSLNYTKGVVRFQQAAQDLANEDLAGDLNMSRRNHDQPQVKDASRVTTTKDGRRYKQEPFSWLLMPQPCQSTPFLATEDVCSLCLGTHK